MARQYVRYEIRNRVAYVTIDRPEVYNALHPPASREMRDAFTEFRDDPDALVAIVTGAGDRAFCTGNDLKYHAENIRPGEVYPEADTNAHRRHHVGLHLLEADHRRGQWLRGGRRGWSSRWPAT